MMLKFIADFADWDNAAKPKYLKTGQALVRAAHPDRVPLVADPFAGGGSIPLEALRLGCEAFASDLNPVACLILEVMLEEVPRHGPELVDGLRRAGAVIRKTAERKLADLYPTDPDGATPIACLWSRTVRCEAPGCGAEIPLVRSMWLSRRAEAQAGSARDAHSHRRGCTTSRVRGVRAKARRRGPGRHGHAGQGELPLLRHGAAIGTSANTARCATRRRGRGVRR